ncbi:MAG: hypothetical protein ACRDF5_11080 [bacterium]
MKIHDPYSGAGTFRRAQLHVHTRRSDGRLEPEEILARYRDAGFSFVGLTDHDRVTTCDALDGPDFLAIPGVEETIVRGIYPLGPHLGRLFVNRGLGRGSVQERLDATRREGGVAVLNHPSWKGNLWTAEWTLDAMRRLRGPFLLEIVNPHSDSAEDSRRWAALLAERSRAEMVGAVAGDDAHSAGQIGRAWIMVKVPGVTVPALRAALEGLAFYATTGPQAEIGAADGVVWCAGDLAEVIFLDRSSRIRAAVAGGEASYRPAGEDRFVRVEARDRAGGRIWSQPFWIDTEEDG